MTGKLSNSTIESVTKTTLLLLLSKSCARPLLPANTTKTKQIQANNRVIRCPDEQGIEHKNVIQRLLLFQNQCSLRFAP